ncbi:hypothetical protein [Streptomyces sp. NPDC001380]|uniref:hypothetical protein n=1 Tax=Streptomyces sp. NPDC001380 TaxID=3364566 RepID=UPI00368A0704
MNGWDQQFRDALQGLAESAERDAAPPLHPARLRRRTEQWRRRRIVLVPSAALAGLLAGGTAYGLAGGFRDTQAPPAPGPVRPAATAPAVPAPADTGPGAPAPGRTSGPAATGSASAGPSRDTGVPAPTAGSPTAGGPAGTATALPLPPPTAQASCAAAGARTVLMRVRGITLRQDPLRGLAAAVEAVPLSCAADPSAPGGTTLAPSGAVRRIPVAPTAAVTTTAPLSTGSRPAVASLAELAAGLARHPGLLFAVRQDAGGRVVRMDQVYEP